MGGCAFSWHRAANAIPLAKVGSFDRRFGYTYQTPLRLGFP